MLKSAKWASLVECENLEALKNLPVRLPRSTQAARAPVLLKQVARFETSEGPNEILRENGKRTLRQYAAQGAELLAESAFPPYGDPSGLVSEGRAQPDRRLCHAFVRAGLGR